MPQFIIDNIKIYSDDSDKDDSDKRNSNKEN